MTTNHAELCECDCLNYCGDDPDLPKRKARPCLNAIDWAHKQALAIEAERERQRKVDLFESQAARIAELEKERDALKADTERYDLLRCRAELREYSMGFYWYIKPIDAPMGMPLIDATLANVIDAAIQDEKETRS